MFVGSYYKVEGISDKKFLKIHTARKGAIDLFAYHKDMGNSNPIIRIYWCNMAGKVEVGKVMKGPGYPVYVNSKGEIYRLSKSGQARKM